MGQSLSINYVKDVFKSYQPDYIFSVLTNSMLEEDAQRMLNLFASNFPQNKVLLAGGSIKESDFNQIENIIILNEVPSLLSFLNELNFEIA